MSIHVPGGASLARGGMAFHHRNYRLFFGGQLVSLVGTWMQAVAQSWLVLVLTGDPFMLGVVAAAQFLPVLVFGLFGGLIADQWPKRRTLIILNALAMGLSTTMFVLAATGLVQVWHVLVIAVLMGFRNAVEMPTRHAFAIEMVGREDIGNAIALNSAMFNGSRIVGPAIAGLIIGAFGVSLAFLVDALSFLAVLLGLVAMDERELRPGPRIARPDSLRGVIDNLAEGLGYVRSTPVVLLAVVVIGLVATAGMNFSVLIPALAKDVLGVGASGFGFLMAAAGIGSLGASLWIAVGGRRSAPMIGAGALVLGLAEVVVGGSRLFPLSLAAMVIVGAGGITMAAVANTLIQLSVPDALRGRVISVYTTVFAGSAPFGGLAMGAIASAIGPGGALVIGGALSAAIGLGAMIVAGRLVDGPIASITQPVPAAGSGTPAAGAGRAEP